MFIKQTMYVVTTNNTTSKTNQKQSKPNKKQNMLVGKKKRYKNNRAFLIVETKEDKLFIVSYEDLLRATKNIITNGSSNFQGAAQY